MAETPARDAGAKRRRDAAERHRPRKVRLLLVAEAPPKDPDRYFYFADVAKQDSLFQYVVKGLYGISPDKGFKKHWLSRLATDGVFQIDLSEDPPGNHDLKARVPGLVERARALRPEKVILIKATVYDLAYRAMLGAGLPVVDHRIPFPGFGHEARFEVEFAHALSSAHIRPHGKAGSDRHI